MFEWLNRLISAKAEESTEDSSPTDPVNRQETVAPSSVPEPISQVSRLVVLNRHAQIVGYEFALRAGASTRSPNDANMHRANNELLVKTVLGMGASRIAQFRQIWLTIDEAGLTEQLLDEMPATATVVLLRPNNHRTAMAPQLEIAKILKAKGFILGLAGYFDRPGYQDWLKLVDIVSLEISAFTPEELISTTASLHHDRAELKVLARRVDSYEEYEYCEANGFDFFSGKFLTHRQNWPPQPQLSPDRTRVCQLLNELRGGSELTEVAAGLKLSPETSFRFLRYVNSAAMSPSNRIASIEQGVLYLGREKLYRWLTLLLFASAESFPTDLALREQALVRGRMMELLAGDKVTRLQLDEMFVTGVFSVLDALLRVPLEIAVKPLQLPPAVAQAILSGTGPYALYLQAVKASEECEVNTNVGAEEVNTRASADTFSAEPGLDTGMVNRLHLQAVEWAQRVQFAETGDLP